jgi:kynurenine formamidase
LNNGQFPTFGLEAIQLLLARNVAGIAIDTLALESLASSFPGHKRLFEHNRYIIENIANADKLPPKGAFVLALPLKIEKGEEAPARVVGLIP